MYRLVILSLCPTEDVKADHPKNHTTALSAGIKANHPRLRDGCSSQRIKSKQHTLSNTHANNNPSQVNVHDLQTHKPARRTAVIPMKEQ
ncbi:hypothetical protein TNCV_1989281 [Trichonephila clavipes]|nr:hypothetical protein TNCV_1989281 [Trichonephila clavipes]